MSYIFSLSETIPTFVSSNIFVMEIYFIVNLVIGDRLTFFLWGGSFDLVKHLTKALFGSTN